MTYLSRIRQVQKSAIKTNASSVSYVDLVQSIEYPNGAGRGELDTEEREIISILRELSVLGLIELPEAGAQREFRLAPDLSLEAILPCLGLMDRIKMALVPLASDGCPVRFCSGFVDFQELEFAPDIQGRLIAVGQGASQAKASLSCLGEMAERLSVLSRGKDDPLVRRSSGCDLLASAMIKFSDSQQVELCRDFPALAPYRRENGIDWEAICDRRVQVTELSGRHTRLTPSLVCLLREGGFFEVPDALITSTNGAASWWNLEGARERATMELIERDAVACWWYNRLVPESYLIPEFGDWLPPDLSDWLAERERKTYFLRLATDLPCAVIAAISHDRSGRNLAYGFKAALSSADAVNGAVLEMAQMEMHLQTISDNLPSERDGDGGGGHGHPLMRMSQGIEVTCEVWVSGNSDQKSPWSQTATWPDLLDALAEKSIPVWTFDTSRADIGVPTIKAISPVLRDWLPRFGGGRLFSLPVDLGLRKGALRADQLNPMRFVC